MSTDALRRAVRTLFCLSLFVAFSAPGWAEYPRVDWNNPQFTEEFVKGELLIGFRGGIQAADRISIHQTVGAEVVRRFSIVPVEHVRVPRTISMIEAARLYAAHPSVEFVEPNYIVRAYPTIPNDPEYGNLWGMDRIRAPEAWDVVTGTHEIVVGVIDTGTYEQHEDLAVNIAAGGFDFANNTPVQIDNDGHGTHVAGTIGAVGDNGVGVVGVNWRVKVIGLKFLDPFGTIADAIRAVEYAATNTALKIKLTNNSWGGGGFSQGLFLAIKEAGDTYGQLFVAAAGNSSNNNDDNPAYPASYNLSNIISVAAIDITGNLASFSNFGTNTVHIGAPGVDILSSVPYGGVFGSYDSFSGTSMASPHVAGAAALLWSMNPDWHYSLIRNAILESAATNAALVNRVSTKGELDLVAAIQKLKPTVTLDRKAYRSDAPVTVTIIDPVLNPVPPSVDFTVEVLDPLDVPRWSEVITAAQDAGIRFSETFQLTSGVTAVEFDTLTITYTNISNEVVIASAPIDDTPPVISEVTVLQVTDDRALIRWHTDEPADSRIIYSPTIPVGGLDVLPRVGEGVFVDTPTVIGGVTQYVHQIALSDLEDATKYFFAVLSEDHAGNEGTSPSDLTSVVEDDYHFFSTLHRRVIYQNNMELGEAGWATTNLNNVPCWEYGIPSFGPPGAHTGERVWGTVLDGNYPALANASLVGTPVDVHLYPRLTFWSWHKFKPGDFGMVEVNDGSGWKNVTMMSDLFDERIEGQSAGWQQVDVNLTHITNKSIRARFRIVSDDLDTAAGWYIDDVEISHVPPPGINIISYVIDDSLGGDGDGFAEPGEWFYLQLEIINSTQAQSLSNVTAAVTIPTPGIDLTSAVVNVTYGDVSVGDTAGSSNQIQVAVDAGIQPGTTFTVFHSAQAAGGLGPWPDSITIPVAIRESVSGVVTNLFTGDPISNATVRGRSVSGGFPDIFALTDGSGQYLLHGLVPGVEYLIRAVKPGEFSFMQHPAAVMGPAVNINFGLGTAYADPDPLAFDFMLDEGLLVHTNISLDNTPGNLPLAADIRVEYAEHALYAGAIGWLEIPPDITVPAGLVSNLNFTVNTSELTPSAIPYEAVIRLVSNDINDEDILIPVTVFVDMSPVLVVEKVLVSGGGDGDPFVEPGETLDLNLFLHNRGSWYAFFAEGGIAYTGASATAVSQPFAAWPFLIGPDEVQGSTMLQPQITVDPLAVDGMVLPFSLVVTDALDRVTSLEFALTTTVRYAISGQVTDLLTTDPVEGAMVKALGAGGGTVAQSVSDALGDYALYGLTNGSYEVYVVPPPPYGAPPSTNVVLSGADVTGIDFQVAAWGVSANPTSITVTVSEGVESNLVLMIDNGGPYPGFVELDIELVQGVPHDLIGDWAAPAINWASLPPEAHAHQELLVRFEDGFSAQSHADALSSVGARIVRTFRLIPAVHVRVPGNQSMASIAQTLTGHPAIRYVEPNYLLELDGLPNDPTIPHMYPLRNVRQTGGTWGADMRAIEAWDITAGHTSVVVAVLDTGVKLDHEDLTDNLVAGYDYGVDDPDPSPDDGGIGAEHGTHVAGTIGATGNNALGIIGVSWQSRIMPLKVSTNIPDLFGFPRTTPVLSATLAALEHAILSDVKISNHSYGSIYFSGMQYEMIAMAMSNDHLVVASAGNSNENNDLYPRYPASYNLPNVLSVAATDHDGLRSPFSNFGANSVDIAAPGSDILSTYFIATFDTYEKLSGTSMAAPHVAGVAALLRSIAPWATFDMVRDAILLGSRFDPALEGLVESAGHLDALGALRKIQAFWLQVSPMSGNIPSGDSLPVSVTINAGGQLPTGTYKADIVVRGGANSLSVPVTVHVLPAPFPVLTDVAVDDTVSGDSDGYAEPGETVDLFLTLLNDGSALFMNPTGTLSSTTPGVVIVQDTATWPGFSSGEQRANQTGFRVTMPGAPGDVDFDLTLTHGVHGPWVIPFTITSQVRHAISGVVRDNQTSAALGGLAVEFWGESGGRVWTESNGFYRIAGLANGTYRVRVLGQAHEKSDSETRIVAGGDQTADFWLRRPEITILPTQLVFAVQTGQDQEQDLVLSNPSSDDFDFSAVDILPRRKVVLISDRSELTLVKPVLEQAGLVVSLRTNNLVTVNGIATGRYSTDDAIVLSHDMVILDLSGAAGVGRLLSAEEALLLKTYLDQGGKVIITGNNLLTRPDDRRLRDLVGADSLDRSVDTGDQADLQNALPLTAFSFDILPGEQVGVTPHAYDEATPDAGAVTTLYFTVNGSTKIMRRFTDSGGEVIFWAGNKDGVEWSTSGIWQDVLRGLVDDSLLSDVVPWLLATPLSGTVSGGATPITVKAESTGLTLGRHHAVLRVRGNYPGADVRSIPVVFDVVQPTLTAKSTTGVKNWMNQFVAGNGGPGSALFQLIYAGPNGQIHPPAADGAATGDDVVLATFPFAVPHGRIGVGFEQTPNLGRFSEVFFHDLLTTTPMRNVYVRAWDAATFSDSVAYGDSSLYFLDLSAWETHDFGTWMIDQVLGYPGPLGTLKDSNGDSVPDGWYVMNGMDPRMPIGPLATSWSTLAKLGSFGTATNQLRFPTRTFLTDSFIYVLDRNNYRISVWNRTNLTHVLNFGSNGTNTSQFGQAYGMGKAPNANRFAVADTPNHRVQVFTFDPSTGVITFERAFGSLGSGAGQFSNPKGVAIGPLGRIYVADTDNHRIQVFDPSGVHLFSFGAFGTGNGQFKNPQGITVDMNGIVFVADTDNHRIQGFNGAGGFLWKTGTFGSGSGQFNKPVGIQIGLGDRIYVADTSNHRVQVLDPMRNHIASLGQHGSGDGQFTLPHDVAPSFLSASMYVADTWNHRIHKLNTIMDGDGDGMDDTWELLNGLDPTDPNDALIDSDGDGLLNIGEYRIQTDPQSVDSDGDGWEDGEEVAAGSSPMDDEAIPVFDLVILSGGGAPYVGMTWFASSGQVFRIQARTNMLTGDWFDLPGSVFTTELNGVTGYTNMLYGGEPMLFYRPVRVDP